MQRKAKQRAEQSRAMDREKGKGVKRAHSATDSAESNFPGDFVTGVEDKLKLVDVGKSFSFPCATFEDPNKLLLSEDKEEVLDDSCKEALNKGSSSILELSEEETHCTDEELNLEVFPIELKINGGKSLSYPYPTMRVRKSQLLDPAQREKLMNDAYNEGRSKHAYLKHIMQVYREVKKAAGICLDDPVHDYSHLSFESFDGGTIELLGRDSGNHIEMLYYKGVLLNNPGSVVIAAGGIPDELKIKGALSLSYPSPISKIRKDLLHDPATRVKALHDSYMELTGPDAFRKAIREAYQKANDGLNSKQSDQRPLAMIEVNVVLPRGTGSSSDKRIKDSNMKK